MRRCGNCHHDFEDDAFSTATVPYCRVCERVRKYDVHHRTDTSLMALQVRCDICDDLPQRLEVDHDHNPDIMSFDKKVRGMLCPSCNKAIAHLKDDPVRAIRAALYLIDNKNLGTLADEKRKEAVSTYTYGFLSSQLDRIVKRYQRITPQQEEQEEQEEG